MRVRGVMQKSSFVLLGAVLLAALGSASPANAGDAVDGCYRGGSGAAAEHVNGFETHLLRSLKSNWE
jgi:hypothetical protein